MPENRFYIDAPLKKNNPITLSTNEHHHLKVMRHQKDDIVEIVNGKGLLANAKIEEISKNTTTLNIESVTAKKEPSTKIILVQSIIKLNRLELILEKACELGILEFWLFNSVNSEKQHLSENKLHRMHSILISAMKQCGSLFLPSIRFFEDLQSCKPSSKNCYFGDTKKEAPSFLDTYKKSQENSYLFVGPEKGFSQEEIDFLENELNAKGVKLNNNILRAETAAISFAAISSHLQMACK